MDNKENLQPLLGLRLKATKPGKIVSFEDAVDSLTVMVLQDRKYRSRDYIGRRRKRQNELEEVSSSDDEEVDASCREKMVEWSYRVCDHFSVSREIVAFAFSFLDRFVDRCSCDRTAFKLASMTSLYIATKMLNIKQISIATLAELSRGEFEIEHLAQMERIIIHTLDYRLNPPTVQAFLTQLRAMFPTMEETVARDVFQRAVYYAELSVYDYYFVKENRYETAVAAILNSIDDCSDPFSSNHHEVEFLENLRSSLCNNLNDAAIQKSQDRLWYLYGNSAESQPDNVQTPLSSETSSKSYTVQENSSFASSPVSVDTHHFC